MPRPARRHDRGSVYLLFLGAAMLVTVIGISSLLVARINHRAATGAEDRAKARGYAESAMELALLLINGDANWRSALGDANWPTDEPIGDGTYTIQVLDEIDGLVSTGAADPLLVTAVGMKGQARQKIQVKLIPHDPSAPLELLNYGMLSATGLIVLVGQDAWADRGAPICTNTSVLNDGTIHGDIEAGSSIVNNGTITGTATAPVPPKALPPPWVFDMYREIATPIPSPGIIDKQVLAPGLNPWGPVNSNGVYFIDADNTTLTIRDSRIHGTLVVRCGPAGRVRLEGDMLLHNYHQNLPTLIVDGDVEMSFASDVTRLDEQLLGVNFNPPGAPFNGVSDGDLIDDYSTEIQGVAHIKGLLQMDGTAEVDGIVICESTVTIAGNNEFNWVMDHAFDPPFGYTDTGAASPMMIVPGSWKQVVD
ncbi:MAG: hypothetical protein ACYSU7_06590 [Planctomycetota bacterium]|jgi:hypothetical protein